MGGRNKSLDGLRGYAAIAVIFYHCFSNQIYKSPKLLEAVTWQDTFNRLAAAVFNGDTAVTVFFIMSGAVLMNSLQHQAGSTWSIAVRFVSDRFFRIYPAMLVSLLACLLAFWSSGQSRSVQEVLENLVLYDCTVNGVTWSLNPEAFATILLLVTLLILRRTTLIVVCVFLVVFVTASRHLPHRDVLLWFRAA